MSRFEAYQICQERGHQSADMILLSNPPMNRCKHCGSTYRYETVLQEFEVPSEEDK